MNPQGGPAIIEIEIAIEIGKLAGLDFDHDFDFDTDSELPRFENKLALPLREATPEDSGTRLAICSPAHPPHPGPLDTLSKCNYNELHSAKT
jgi:hypothetical protein